MVKIYINTNINKLINITSRNKKVLEIISNKLEQSNLQEKNEKIKNKEGEILTK